MCESDYRTLLKTLTHNLRHIKPVAPSTLLVGSSRSTSPCTISRIRSVSTARASENNCLCPPDSPNSPIPRSSPNRALTAFQQPTHVRALAPASSLYPRQSSAGTRSRAPGWSALSPEFRQGLPESPRYESGLRGAESWPYSCHLLKCIQPQGREDPETWTAGL